MNLGVWGACEGTQFSPQLQVRKRKTNQFRAPRLYPCCMKVSFMLTCSPSAGQVLGYSVCGSRLASEDQLVEGSEPEGSRVCTPPSQPETPCCSTPESPLELGDRGVCVIG